jgi:hypothetical protein
VPRLSISRAIINSLENSSDNEILKSGIGVAMPIKSFSIQITALTGIFPQSGFKVL